MIAIDIRRDKPIATLIERGVDDVILTRSEIEAKTYPELVEQIDRRLSSQQVIFGSVEIYMDNADIAFLQEVCNG